MTAAHLGWDSHAQISDSRSEATESRENLMAVSEAHGSDGSLVVVTNRYDKLAGARIFEAKAGEVLVVPAAVIERELGRTVIQTVTQVLGTSVFRTNRFTILGSGEAEAGLSGVREIIIQPSTLVEGGDYRTFDEVRQILAEDGSTTRKTNRVVQFEDEATFAEAISRSPEVLEWGPHHKVMQGFVPVSNAPGDFSARASSYTSLGTGLAYQDEEGVWHDSVPEFEISPSGREVLARKTRHKVILAVNPTKENPVDVLLPDGKRLRSQVLGLGYFDFKSGKSVVIAELKSAQAELAWNRDEVIYRDAFNGISADLRYVLSVAGLEQDIVLREQPPGPEDYGLDPIHTHLQVITEFFPEKDPQISQQIVKHEADPIKRLEMMEPDVTDDVIAFGSMRIGRGLAFGTWENEGQNKSKRGLPVIKAWQNIDGRSVLFESVQHVDLKPLLERLPAAEPAGESQKRQASLQRILPRVQIAEIGKSDERVKLARSGDSHSIGIVFDYALIDTQSDLILTSGATYFVQNTVTVNGLTIQPGAMVKYATGKTLVVSGSLSCPSSGKAYFVAQTDNSLGELVADGTPSGYFASDALSLNNINNGTVVRNLEFRNAQRAVNIYSSGSYTVRDCRIINCSIGIIAYYTTVYGINLSVCNVPQVIINGNNALISETGTTVYCPPPVTTPALVSSVSSFGEARNTWDGWVGFEFTVGSSPIKVNQLGRWIVSANSGSHMIRLFNTAGAEVVNGFAILDTLGKASGQFAYAQLPEDVTLNANTPYLLMSREYYGGDQWYDLGGTYITLDPVASSPYAAYATTANPAAYIRLYGNMSYGPVNLRFVPPNTPPTISAIGNVSIVANSSTSPLSFTVSDLETSATSLSVSATSGNSALLPVEKIAFGGSGANRTVTVTPMQYQTGSATVTVTVSDGSLTATSSFTVTVPTNYDNDDLPDTWELQYFGNLAETPQGDPDGDGFSNLQEYQNGTRPTPLQLQQIQLLGNSDTLISIPVLRPSAAQCAVVSYSGNSLQVSGAGSWSVNQWVYAAGTQPNTYYLLVLSGALEGGNFTITANDASSLVVDTSASPLTGLSAGDALAIIPHWTLGTIFPGGEGIHVSPKAGMRHSEIYFPAWSGIGVNLAPTATYYYLDGHWRQVAQGLTVKDDVVVPPDKPFWVRHNLSYATYVYARGVAWLGKWRTQIRRQPDIEQDNWLAIPRLITETLNESGLVSSGAFRSSQTAGNRVDELYFYDNTVSVINKVPSGTYYYRAGAWKRVAFGNTDVGNDPVFAPGIGVFVRADPGSNAVWVNEGDRDQDSLPDGWESLYFGNLSQTGSGDWDGDGITNAQERMNGTNPTLFTGLLVFTPLQ